MILVTHGITNIYIPTLREEKAWQNPCLSMGQTSFFNWSKHIDKVPLLRQTKMEQSFPSLCVYKVLYTHVVVSICWSKWRVAYSPRYQMCRETNSTRIRWYYLFEKQITLSFAIKRNTRRCCKSFYPSYWPVCWYNNLYTQQRIRALLDMWWKRQKCLRLTSLSVRVKYLPDIKVRRFVYTEVCIHSPHSSKLQRTTLHPYYNWIK